MVSGLIQCDYGKVFIYFSKHGVTSKSKIPEKVKKGLSSSGESLLKFSKSCVAVATCFNPRGNFKKELEIKVCYV